MYRCHEFESLRVFHIVFFSKKWLFWTTEKIEKVFVAISKCFHIGQFLKCLGDKFSYKSNPNIWWLLCYFARNNSLNQLQWLQLGNFWKIGILLFQHLWSNLKKHLMIVIYNSRVVWLENCPYYDSWVVIYARKMFIR